MVARFRNLAANIVPTGPPPAVGSTRLKGYHAPVVVWHGATRERVYTLHGHTIGVNILSFSPDERFLCACGEDALLYIWDMLTGEVVFGKRHSKTMTTPSRHLLM